ncbi:MAG: PD-(D/E)XK nuclease family protein [Planctomycetia bacterium]|nr:PD-(D/E)XK nuclease family protein [Planctomycetia bacterium]
MANATALAPIRQPLPVIDHLSFSAISTFQTCSLRFAFKYLYGLPEEAVGASLVFGAAIHASLQFFHEQLLVGNAPPDLDTLLGVYQDAWQRNEGQTVLFGKGEDLNSLGRLADRVLTVFLNSELAQPEGDVIAIEEELRGVLVPGCPDLLARIDLIFETKDAVIIRDYKTARRPWSGDQAQNAAPQLFLYADLARNLAGSKPVRLEFAVLTKDRFPQVTLHPVAVDPHQVARTHKIVERVWHAIEAGNFYPSPSPLNCGSCPYRRPCREWVG